MTSRLLEYQSLDSHPRAGAGAIARRTLRQVTTRLAFLELVPPVLARALEPFPVRLRTLDALHLSSIEFLREQRQHVELAS